MIICIYIYMFPKIVGFPPKSSINNRDVPIFTIQFGGTFPPIFGSTPICILHTCLINHKFRSSPILPVTNRHETLTRGQGHHLPGAPWPQVFLESTVCCEGTTFFLASQLVGRFIIRYKVASCFCRESDMRKLGLVVFHHPSEKYYIVKLDHETPRFGMKITKIFETTT